MEKPFASVVLPVYKALGQDLDARFTLIGLVEQSSSPMETSCNLFNTLVTLSDGMNYVMLCISLAEWESHPKCLRRGDVLLARNCRRVSGSIVLKGTAAAWILLNGREVEAAPMLPDSEALAVKQLRWLVASGALGFVFSTKFYSQAYFPRRRRLALDSLTLVAPLYDHLEQLFRPLTGFAKVVSLDAVQVAIFWPFHESYWGAVLWDGYGFGFWAAALDLHVIAILHDAVSFCSGWIRIKVARLQARITDGLPELLLSSVVAISPKQEDDVLTRLEHKEAFGPCHVPAPHPVVLKGWHNYMWLCNSCLCTSYWPKVYCYCCGKRFDVLHDDVIKRKEFH